MLSNDKIVLKYYKNEESQLPQSNSASAMHVFLGC